MTDDCAARIASGHRRVELCPVGEHLDLVVEVNGPAWQGTEERAEFVLSGRSGAVTVSMRGVTGERDQPTYERETAIVQNI